MPIRTSSSGATKGPSNAPTIGTATAGDSSASVTFTAPSFSKLPVTSYTVTASPGGATGTGASSPITVSGLSNGTAYTFTVSASNGNGASSPSSASNSITPAPAMPPAFYAVGSYNYASNSSTDGITWTQVSMPLVGTTNNDSYGTSWWAAYGNGIIYAQSTYGDQSNFPPYQTATSANNGASWTLRTISTGLGAGGQVPTTFGNGKFVLVNSTTGFSGTSTDGITWAQYTQSTGPLSSGYFIDMAYGNGRYVAITFYNSKTASSTDGVTWTEGTFPSVGPWFAVTYGSSNFVAVAKYGSDKAAYSTNGISWTASTLPAAAQWFDVTYGASTFVAIAGYGNNKAATSTNGVSWTLRTLPVNNTWGLIQYNAGKFVALPFGGFDFATSTNGITWTQRTLPVEVYHTMDAFVKIV